MHSVFNIVRIVLSRRNLATFAEDVMNISVFQLTNAMKLSQCRPDSFENETNCSQITNKSHRAKKRGN
jgi:hypothetical protein